MKEKQEILEEVKGRYGFSKTDTKWLPEGSSMMEYIGMDVISIDFTKNPETNDWSSTLSKAVIHSLTDYDPMSGTYLCKYSTLDMEDGSWKEVRIIPEGFELIGPDSLKMIRFVPYSLHTKMVETEEFYRRLFILQAKTKTLPIQELNTIVSSSDQSRILEYSHNIGAVIKTEDNEVLWFRIKNISLRHLHGTKYHLTLTAWDNKRYVLGEIDSNDEEYVFTVNHQDIGKFKIIDLSRQ